MKRSVVVYNYAASFFSTTPEEHFRGVQHIQKTLDASETWPIEKDTSYKIPLQTHRIWLTDATNPEEIPENQLAYYRESLTHYASDIQHHFWCLDCANIPLSIQKLQEMGVLIHTIDPDTLITKRLVQKLIADKLYGFASNLVRYEVLFQNGGLYTDIGLRQTRDLSYLFKKFDAIFYVQPTGEIDVRGMAFPKDSLFLKEHLTFIQQLPTLDCVQKSINLYGGSSQGITTGYILNAKVPIFALQHPEIRIGFFKENQDFTYHGMLKWKANWIKIFMKAHPLYFFDFSTY